MAMKHNRVQFCQLKDTERDSTIRTESNGTLESLEIDLGPARTFQTH